MSLLTFESLQETDRGTHWARCRALEIVFQVVAFAGERLRFQRWVKNSSAEYPNISWPITTLKKTTHRGSLASTTNHSSQLLLGITRQARYSIEFLLFILKGIFQFQKTLLFDKEN